MADDVDGVIPGMGLRPLRHLRQAILGRIEQHNLDARLHPVDQRLVIGDVVFDEDDLLLAVVLRRVGCADLDRGGHRRGRGRGGDRLGLPLVGAVVGRVIAVVAGGGGVGAVVRRRRGVGGGGPGGVEHEARFQREGQRRPAARRPRRAACRVLRRRTALRRTLHPREPGFHRHTRQKPEDRGFKPIVDL
ncbi:hypothetical protein [Azospirillum sp. TSO35-2]|uniref:hypothetical protein n=1 Tax=Azospirillum sp. TSO35-2 TaxID=716796 RepID=UPI001FFE57DB|nr:hypothetical protein [Azospirillum sp. TSO35-2]